MVMKKRIFFITFLFAALWLSPLVERVGEASAQTGLGDMQRGVGVISGDAITERNAGIGAEGTYRLAAMLTADDLKPYIGCDVVGIRFAMGMDMTRSSVFINTVHGNSIDSEVISQTVRYPSQGWNNIYFNGGNKYTVAEGEGLMFGFEYTETATMVANDEGAICINGDNTTGNGFFLYGNFGQGEGWYSSETGNLCVQLIVDVSNMTPYDIAYSMFTAGHKYKNNSEGVDFLCSFNNAGRDNIETADFSFLIDNKLAETYRLENTKGENSMTIDHRVPFAEPLAIGEHTFTIRLDKINGNAVSEDRSVSENFVIYDASLRRQKHCVEQYMSQKSLYNQYTDQIMNEVTKKDNVCLVNMYNVDGQSLGLSQSLYVEGAEKYISRYAYAYPCFTVDRYYYPGELYVAYDVNDYAQTVPEIMVGVIDQIVDEQDLYPAFATVNITPEYDPASRSLSIQVSGDLIENAKQLMGNNAVLTVMLTENNVQATQYVTDRFGRSRPDSKYVHNNVLRMFVSSADGDAIDLSANSYTKNYTITIPESINAENVEVVATVSRGVEPNAFNFNNYDVTNCNSVALESYVSGIESVQTLNAQTPKRPYDQIYNLHGQRVNAAHKGIVITGGKKFIAR